MIEGAVLEWQGERIYLSNLDPVREPATRRQDARRFVRPVASILGTLVPLRRTHRTERGQAWPTRCVVLDAKEGLPRSIPVGLGAGNAPSCVFRWGPPLCWPRGAATGPNIRPHRKASRARKPQAGSFLFDPTSNTISSVTSVPTALSSVLNSQSAFPDMMLVLPNGQLLFGDFLHLALSGGAALCFGVAFLPAEVVEKFAARDDS